MSECGEGFLILCHVGSNSFQLRISKLKLMTIPVCCSVLALIVLSCVRDKNAALCNVLHVLPVKAVKIQSNTHALADVYRIAILILVAGINVCIGPCLHKIRMLFQESIEFLGCLHDKVIHLGLPIIKLFAKLCEDTAVLIAVNPLEGSCRIQHVQLPSSEEGRNDMPVIDSFHAVLLTDSPSCDCSSHRTLRLVQHLLRSLFLMDQLYNLCGKLFDFLTGHVLDMLL